MLYIPLGKAGRQSIPFLFRMTESPYEVLVILIHFSSHQHLIVSTRETRILKSLLNILW
ncbi:MAG: hypothetical protein MR404_04035 [Prevotellaceae bacterium]|nr:hypothetical protein [Prevotellaceae bacterium]